MACSQKCKEWLLRPRERRSHCQNNFGNAVLRRSRWKRSLISSRFLEQFHVHYMAAKMTASRPFHAEYVSEAALTMTSGLCGLEWLMMSAGRTQNDSRVNITDDTYDVRGSSFGADEAQQSSQHELQANKQTRAVCHKICKHEVWAGLLDQCNSVLYIQLFVFYTVQ